MICVRYGKAIRGSMKKSEQRTILNSQNLNYSITESAWESCHPVVVTELRILRKTLE